MYTREKGYQAHMSTMGTLRRETQVHIIIFLVDRYIQLYFCGCVCMRVKGAEGVDWSARLYH